MKVSAPRPAGSWLTENYDKLALVIALTLLLGSGLILASRAHAIRQEFRERRELESARVGKPAPDLDMALVTNLVQRLQKPFRVQPGNKRFMVGELRVASIPDGLPIPFAATRDPFTGKDQPAVDIDPDSDGDGIPDRVETAWGLNPFDPSDARLDADGDGYSNVEEHLAKTDPKDPQSFPPPIAKLRLLRTVTDPFRFIFAGISGERFQLNTRERDRTYFVSLGDEVEGYKVEKYEAQAPGGPTLILTRGGVTYRLIRGRLIADEARSALLIFLVDNTRYRVRVNDVFTLRDKQYKVIDIRDDRVVLRDEQTGQVSNVGILTRDEIDRLSGVSSSSEPAGGTSP